MVNPPPIDARPMRLDYKAWCNEYAQAQWPGSLLAPDAIRSVIRFILSSPDHERGVWATLSRPLQAVAAELAEKSSGLPRLDAEILRATCCPIEGAELRRAAGGPEQQVILCLACGGWYEESRCAVCGLEHGDLGGSSRWGIPLRQLAYEAVEATGHVFARRHHELLDAQRARAVERIGGVILADLKALAEERLMLLTDVPLAGMVRAALPSLDALLGERPRDSGRAKRRRLTYSPDPEGEAP